MKGENEPFIHKIEQKLGGMGNYFLRNLLNVKKTSGKKEKSEGVLDPKDKEQKRGSTDFLRCRSRGYRNFRCSKSKNKT